MTMAIQTIPEQSEVLAYQGNQSCPGAWEPGARGQWGTASACPHNSGAVGAVPQNFLLGLEHFGHFGVAVIQIRGES